MSPKALSPIVLPVDPVAAMEAATKQYVDNRFSAGSGVNGIGEVIGWGGAAAPTGFLLCDGAAVSRTTYAALFAITSTTYGVGDNSTTFNVPNLTGRFVLGVSGSHPRGQTGGAETHTLSTAEMPSHQHVIYDGNDNGYVVQAGVSYGLQYSASLSGAAGSGGAHNNMPPFGVLNFIIRHTAWAGMGGPTGPQGPTGPAGTPGSSGMMSGSGVPTAGVGVDGSIYLDYTTGKFYGPKASGAWPSTSIGTLFTPTTVWG